FMDVHRRLPAHRIRSRSDVFEKAPVQPLGFVGELDRPQPHPPIASLSVHPAPLPADSYATARRAGAGMLTGSALGCAPAQLASAHRRRAAIPAVRSFSSMP